MSESIWNDPRITAYVLGELPEEDRQAFEAEMRSDSALSTAVDEARGVTGQLSELYAAESMPPLDEARREAILRPDVNQVALPAKKHAPANGMPWVLLASAAIILLLIGVAPWLNRHETDYTVTQAAPPPVDPSFQRRSPTDDTNGAEADAADAMVSRAIMVDSQESDLPSISLNVDSGSRHDDIGPMKGSQRSGRVQTGATDSVTLQGDIDALVDGSASVGLDGDAEGLSRVKRLSAESPDGDPRSLETVEESDISDAFGATASGSRTILPIAPADIPGERYSFRNGSSSPAAQSASTAPQPAPATPPGPAPAAEPDASERPAIASARLQPEDNERTNFAERDTDELAQESPAGQTVSEARFENGKRAARPRSTAAPTVHRYGDKSIIDSKKSASDLSAELKKESVAESARGRRGTAGPAEDLEEAQVEFVPELGTIIVRGSKRDVTQVEAKIRELKELADAPEVEAQLRQKIERVSRGQKLNVDYLESVVTADGRLSKLSALGRGAAQEQRGLEARDFGLAVDEGRGPGISGDRFEPITDNEFLRVGEHPLSTFSVDVDTASYSKVRDVLTRSNQLPRPDAVRIEELVNYFEYDYAPPADDAEHPFAAKADITSCPWNEDHRLARIAIKGKTMKKGQRPPCNLVFLLDTSGSMDAANKLPLVIRGMKMLLGELRDKDKVAITVYAGSAGLVLDSTSAKKEKKIANALARLSAGGSTNGGAGIALAYQTARDHFIADGVNRVILCTDGDFNVGTTGTDELVRMVEKEAKGGVFLSVLGFGMGNHNDAMLEKISGRGNGNYAFIDTDNEARKVLVDQTSGTLVTIAKNVKMQVEFNPSHVAAYRLIGYENRVLAKEDFNDDKKDAGEIGAGHAVTALYEIVPAGSEAVASAPPVDDLKYQSTPQLTAAADSDESFTLKLRYLQPDAVVEKGDESTLIEIPVRDDDGTFEEADSELRFAAAVAAFGMKLRRSPHAGTWTLSDVLAVAETAAGKDRYELRAEFSDLVRKASELMGEE